MGKIKILLRSIYPFLISLYLWLIAYDIGPNRITDIFYIIDFSLYLFGCLFLVGVVLFVVQTIKDLCAKRKVAKEDHTTNPQ